MNRTLSKGHTGTQIFDESPHYHTLTLKDAIQSSISKLQHYQIIDANLQPSSNFASKFVVGSRSNNDDGAGDDYSIETNKITICDAIKFAMNIQQQRQSSNEEFLSKLNSKQTQASSSSSSSSWPIDTVQIMHSSSASSTSSASSSSVAAANMNKTRTCHDAVMAENHHHKQQNKSSDKILHMSPLQFKQKYLYSNIPCLIRGLDEYEFQAVSRNWVTPSSPPLPSSSPPLPSSLLAAERTTTHTVLQEQSQCTINTDWFLREIGPSTLVPVRRNPRTKKKHNDNLEDNNDDDDDDDEEEEERELDEEGRATECETIQMRMDDWIQFLAEQYNDIQVGKSRYNHHHCHNIKGQTGDSMVDSTLYLKDWHLQNILDHKWNVVSLQQSRKEEQLSSSLSFGTPLLSPTTTSITITPEIEILYIVPEIFDGDIFNPFLLSNGGGDYRFVYWGPFSSSTSIHTDVLHTFSWSFNVLGEKKWIFYPPTNDTTTTNAAAAVSGVSNSNVTIPLSFEIIQKTGETIYVPSGWKHSVHNLTETLSINHNWITPSTLDAMYKCILCEIKAIEKELKDWGMAMDNNNANDDDSEFEDKFMKSERINGIDIPVPCGNVNANRMREDMLRGCVGMDVTSFCSMMFASLTDCLINLHKYCQTLGVASCATKMRTEGPSCTRTCTKNDDLQWQYWFDLTCIVSLISTIMLKDSKETGGKLPDQTNKNEQTLNRFCAILGANIGKNLYYMLLSLSNECESLIKQSL